MWIVGVQEQFYPSINEFKTEEEAKRYYSEKVKNYKEEIFKGEMIIYLAEVKEKIGHE